MWQPHAGRSMLLLTGIREGVKVTCKILQIGLLNFYIVCQYQSLIEVPVVISNNYTDTCSYLHSTLIVVDVCCRWLMHVQNCISRASLCTLDIAHQPAYMTRVL